MGENVSLFLCPHPGYPISMLQVTSFLLDDSCEQHGRGRVLSDETHWSQEQQCMLSGLAQQGGEGVA